MSGIEIEGRFLKAVQVVQQTGKDEESLSNDEKLKFYALYKQATVGPCNVQKPAFWDVVSRAKWDAWKNLGQLSTDDAMEEYVDELILYLKRFPDRPKAQDLIISFQKSRGDLSQEEYYEDASPVAAEPHGAMSNGLAHVLARPFSRTPSAIMQPSINPNSMEERVRKLELGVAALQDRLEQDAKAVQRRKKKIPVFVIALVIFFILRNKSQIWAALKSFLLNLL